jgi:DNA-binding XRE family transcriptional regulator
VLGVSVVTVHGLRVEFALPRPAVRRTSEVNRRRHALKRAELAVRLESMGVLTSAEAAVVLGVSRNTILAVRREYGLPGPRKPTEKRRGRFVSDRSLPDPEPR